MARVNHHRKMKMDEKQAFINIFERASKLLFGNINLVLFLFLCSLPLFCFLIFFELSLQTTISLASHYLLSRQLSFPSFYYFYDDVSQDHVLTEKLIPLLLQTFLLYLLPYSLLDLVTTTTIVSASSIVYTSEEQPLSFGQLVSRTVEICKNRLGGCLITSLYVLLLSTSLLFGFFFVSTNYFYIIYFLGLGDYSYNYSYISLGEDGNASFHTNFNSPRMSVFDTLMAMFHAAIFVVLLAKFSKWSAGWNMGLVVSVLEDDDEDCQGVYGSDALSLSAYYGRGNEKLGMWVMLVCLVCALAMRIPCLCFKCSEIPSGNGALYTSFYVGLICIGNMIKWVACVVFYHDCRTKVLEKKSDVEIGSKAKASTT